MVDGRCEVQVLKFNCLPVSLCWSLCATRVPGPYAIISFMGFWNSNYNVLDLHVVDIFVHRFCPYHNYILLSKSKQILEECFGVSFINPKT